ncbi:MAG TPA: GatB/YqeY domain-containing protein [Tepidisphaeraceae bacterium]|nr:GatB/YqeY domain-containing protein [Tepidisphaeraceae bacterium]
MSLLERLQEDMKTAMKAGERERLGVVRMLIADLKVLDLQPKKITEEESVAAYGKKLRKGIEEYEKLGKPDQVAKLKSELAIVESYLPKQASPEDTERIVDEFLAKNTFGEKQLGQAMGALMKAYRGQIEPGVANALLRKKLAGK